MTGGPISVVIAAHNEEGVLDRCLSTLLDGARPGELDVVVVCNGCSDGTEAVAGAFGPPVTAVSTPVASKTGALNLGDRVAVGFPRLYIDADTELGIDAVRAIRDALGDGQALAASPGLHVDTSKSSYAVRAYIRFWSALPSIRDDIVGRGVYALSAAGRSTFDQFPDVIADDHFVRTVVPASARITVPGCHSVVKAPRSLRSLVRRSVRIHSGNREVDPHAVAAPHGWVSVMRRNPVRIADFPFYALVVAVAKARGRWLCRDGRLPEWGRDDSRQPVPAGFSPQLRSAPLDASTV